MVSRLLARGPALKAPVSQAALSDIFQGDASGNDSPLTPFTPSSTPTPWLGWTPALTVSNADRSVKKPAIGPS